MNNLTATTPAGTFTRKTEKGYQYVVVFHYWDHYTKTQKIAASWHTTKANAAKKAKAQSAYLIGVYPVDSENDELNGWIPVSEEEAKQIEENEKGMAKGKKLGL